MTPKEEAASKPLRIFVRAPNWVGDAIMATPALAYLRHSYPVALITLMARPWVAPVYEHNPDINQLWVHDDSLSLASFWKGLGMVRQERFTLGLALPNSFRAAALLFFGGVRFRVGYLSAGRGSLLNYGVRIKPDYLQEHQIYYYLHLVESLCGPCTESPKLALCPGSLEREEIRRLLAQFGLDRGRPLVGLAPGSINSTAKRWSAERFAALADRLVHEAKAEILLLGSEKEKDVLDRVAAQCQKPVHNLVGQVSLGQMIALTERLAGLICNDSGAMHIGAALGTPTVAIFGPTEWNTTFPFSRLAKVTRKPVDCAPCMLRECPTDHCCMNAVQVEDVFKDFKQLIKESRKKSVKSTTKE